MNLNFGATLLNTPFLCSVYTIDLVFEDESTAKHKIKSNHMHQKNKCVTHKDVAFYRSQVDTLEELIRQRDEIMDSIGLIHVVLCDLSNKMAVAKVKTAKVKTAKVTKHMSLADRLTLVCKGGATKAEIAEAMGLGEKTIEAYLYSSKIGGKILARGKRADGTTVWVPAASSFPKGVSH